MWGLYRANDKEARSVRKKQGQIPSRVVVLTAQTGLMKNLLYLVRFLLGFFGFFARCMLFTLAEASFTLVRHLFKSLKNIQLSKKPPQCHRSYFCSKFSKYCFCYNSHSNQFRNFCRQNLAVRNNPLTIEKRFGRKNRKQVLVYCDQSQTNQKYTVYWIRQYRVKNNSGRERQKSEICTKKRGQIQNTLPYWQNEVNEEFIKFGSFSSIDYVLFLLALRSSSDVAVYLSLKFVPFDSCLHKPVRHLFTSHKYIKKYVCNTLSFSFQLRNFAAKI